MATKFVPEGIEDVPDVVMDFSSRIKNENMLMEVDDDNIYDREAEDSRPVGHPRLLMVKGSKSDPAHVISLSRAILMSLAECNVAELQAIGPPSVSNMVKAFIKAKSALQEYVNDAVLTNTLSYQSVKIEGKVITAIRMRIFGIPNSVVI